MLIAGCDADASYPAYRVLSGLARLIRPDASYPAWRVLSGLHVPAMMFNG